MFIISLSLFHGQMVGRRMVVANRGERLSLPMESLQHRAETGRSWARSDTQNICGVERKIDMKGGKSEYEEENGYPTWYQT
jgi:hypothetical protein